MKKKYLWILTGLSLWLLPHISLAFGISPGTTAVDNLLSTSRVEATIYISRADATTTDQVIAAVTGDAASAIVLPQTTMDLPQGENSVAFPIIIQPNQFKPGSYTATIDFTYQPAAVVDTGTPTQVAVQATIQFTVTDQTVTQMAINSFKLTQNPDQNTETLHYTVTNSGNTPSGPDSMTIHYRNLVTDQSVTETLTKDQLAAVVPAFSTQDFTHTSSTIFAPGNYEVTGDLFDQTNNSIATLPALHFQIQNSDGTFVLSPNTPSQPSPDFSWKLWVLCGFSVVVISSVVCGIVWYSKTHKL